MGGEENIKRRVLLSGEFILKGSSAECLERYSENRNK